MTQSKVHSLILSAAQRQPGDVIELHLRLPAAIGTVTAAMCCWSSLRIEQGILAGSYAARATCFSRRSSLHPRDRGGRTQRRALERSCTAT